MVRTCTICRHEDRAEVERALVQREPYRHIATRYDVSTGALQRHAREHLPELLAKAHEAEQAARADELLMDVRRLQEKTLLTLQHAEASGEWSVLLRAVREARENIELLARLRGELDMRPVINLVLSPEWLELRALIVGALEPHPEAREAVVHAIAPREDNGSS